MHTYKRLHYSHAFIIISLLLLLSGFPDTVRSSDNSPVTREKQTIVLTTIFPSNWPAYAEMYDIYTEAFARLGYQFRLVFQPGERSMIDANQGVADGEAARIMNLDGKRYANLIRVPESIITMQEGAYAVDDSITVDGWKSLTNTAYRVGSLKGIKATEQKLPLYFDNEHIVSFTTPKQGFAMLKAGRIDLFFVGAQVEGSPLMQSGEYDGVKRVGVVETKILYPWLHKRHRELVQPLADVLQTMKSEGIF